MNHDSGFVYLIQAGSTGPVKVGSTQNPRHRLGQLQCGNAEELRIIHLFPGASREREFHDALGAFHIRGEWYRPEFLKDTA